MSHICSWIFIDLHRFSLRRSKCLKITKTMFYVFCLFTPLYRRFRLSHVCQTIEPEEIYRLVSKIPHFMPCGSVFGRFCVLWKNIENLSNIYRKSIENRSKIFRDSFEDLSKIYRKSIENL